MDDLYMEMALELALLGKGMVSPNPVVGAVIVKENKVIGKGYHERYGYEHAEVNAFKDAEINGADVEGATMYVTLEPCSHYGKTPPCADKIIEKKIGRVVVGSLDPNPVVAGRGIKKLQDAGIEVQTLVLDDKCKKINEVFMKYIVKKEPFVIMKAAMSLDGKISTYKGESKWITCETSRENVHKLRGNISAIMVGVETVIMDDPELTCRLPHVKSPIRIVVDSKLRIPKDSKVLTKQDKYKTIISTTELASAEDINYFKNIGIELIITQSIDNRVNLKELMCKLGALNIDSLLIEGGGTLNYSALKAGIIDKVQFYIAPIIIGGENSRTPVEGMGIDNLSEAYKLENLQTEVIGTDIFIEAYVRRR